MCQTLLSKLTVRTHTYTLTHTHCGAAQSAAVIRGVILCKGGETAQPEIKEFIFYYSLLNDLRGGAFVFVMEEADGRSLTGSDALMCSVVSLCLLEDKKKIN